MSLHRPGEFRITDSAFEIMQLSKGAEILDIGCGEGDTIKYLTEKGYKMSGIDLKVGMVNKASELNSKAKITLGDGEFLDEFSSYSFDCVMMECVLSLINLPDEALHEAYCVLKKGGKLYISDLMIKNPDPAFAKALAIEAERLAKKPHEEGECHDDCAEEHKKRVVKFRGNGRFLVEQLIEELEEIGYINVQWKDFSMELDSYVAETILQEGSLDSCFCEEALNREDNHKTGYFMLVAEKPL